MTRLRSVAIVNRRNSPRLPARVSIGLEVGGRIGAMEMSCTRDFSSGGVFVETSRAVPLGTTLDVFFMPPGAQHSLRLMGQVVRQTPDGIGIAFKRVADDVRRALDAFLGSLKAAADSPLSAGLVRIAESPATGEPVPVPVEAPPASSEPELLEVADADSVRNPQEAAARLHALARRALESDRPPQEAILLLERAIDLAPYVAVYHHDLGTALYRAGEVGRAVVELDKALWLEPEEEGEGR